VKSLDDGAPALYDLAADPAELTDIAGANADKVAVMERHLEAWGKMVAAVSLDPELRTAEELDDATLDQLRSGVYPVTGRVGNRVGDRIGPYPVRASLCPCHFRAQ
jgi:hypothetical protein